MMDWRWSLDLAAGLVFSGLMAAAALAEEGGVPEEQLNDQGLESRSQAKEGYTALNEAAFLLLFDETARFDIWGARSDPRKVTVINAASAETALWAYNRHRQHWNKLQEFLATQDSGAKEDEMEKSTLTPLNTEVRLQFALLDAPQKAAVSSWAGERGISVRPASIYRPNLLDRVSFETQLTDGGEEEENSEGSILGQIFGGAVEAVEEAADINITFSSGDGDAEPQSGSQLELAARILLSDSERWQDFHWGIDPELYDGALDGALGWRGTPKLGLSLRGDYSAFYSQSQGEKAAANGTRSADAGSGGIGSKEWQLENYRRHILRESYVPSDNQFGDQRSDAPSDSFDPGSGFRVRF